MIEVGQLAPDFTLRDQNNEEVTLSSFRGAKAVLVIFYPLAFTGICTGELCVVRDDLSSFQNDEVQVVTISVDSQYSHKIFAEREGYALMPEYDYKPVNRYLPPRPRRDGCADATAKAAPTETLDTAQLPGVLRWLDRVLSR